MKLRVPLCIRRRLRGGRSWNDPIIPCIAVSTLTIIGTLLATQGYLSRKQIESNINRGTSELSQKSPQHICNVYMSRLTRAQDVCLNSKPRRVRRIMVDKTKTIANCVIPKVGCSFWINIFRFINNETNGTIYKSPFHIPRWITHYSNRSSEYSIPDNTTAPAFLRNAFRFMFVRDPYKRLWASWIDKFLLPDFWFGTGNVIAARRGFDERATRCPTNITFTDFLIFITDDYFSRHPENHDEHWAPFHEFCDPCIFHPHFIGKMETFKEDSEFVLTTTNLSWVKQTPLPLLFPLRGIHTNQHKNIYEDAQFASRNNTKKQLNDQSRMQLKASDEHILHEMEIITNYIFHEAWKYLAPEIEMCASKYFVAQRLWQAFQYNGYIPKDCVLVLSDEINLDILKEALLSAYSEWGMDYTNRRQRQQEQKRNAMQAAYQIVPLRVMKKIQNIYMNDFLQFGYDPEPEDLFHREP